MDENDKFNQIIIDNLPHCAMLIDVKTRTILAANKLAFESGAKINCQCWEGLGNRQFISEEHKKMIEADPERKRDQLIKCQFCLADEAMASGKPIQKAVEIDETIWDIWWIPAGKDIYLHYAINITDILKIQIEHEKACDKIKKLSGLILICSHCKKIRDDQGHWNNLENYISKHSDAVFSHGICYDCTEEYYPDYNNK